MAFFDNLLCCCQSGDGNRINRARLVEETHGDCCGHTVKCCGFIFNTTNLYVIIGIVGAILGTGGTIGLCAALGVPGLASVSGFLFTAGTAVGATPVTLSAFITAVGGACIITAMIGLSVNSVNCLKGCH